MTIHPEARHHRPTPRRPTLTLALIAILVALSGIPAAAMEITPFRTGNMSPLVQIFGLPVPDSARVLRPHEGEVSISADLANNFAIDEENNEAVELDGETYRGALDLRYGLAPRFEAGIEIPVVAHSGGFLDGFVEWFHRTFGFDTGGRDEVPRGRLVYRYEQNGSDKLLMDDGNVGLGDIRLTGGVQLYDEQNEAPRSVSLRAALKLPTGNSHKLRGSGSVDFSLWLNGSDDFGLGPAGHLTVYGSAGGTVMSDGDVLEDQQRNLAAFASAGFGWSPADWIALKAQAVWHTAIYRSELRELGYDTLMGTIGGTLAFTDRTSLDLGVSEDMSVKTAPDVTFNFALHHRF